MTGVAASEVFPPVDFVAFYERRVPELLAVHGALAGGDVAGVPPVALRVGGDAFTYVPRRGSVDVVPGEADAETVVSLTPEIWSEYAHELRSAFGLMIGEVAEVLRGDLGWLVRWEPALRALWHGRPVYDAAAVDAVADLDLGRSFDFDRSSDAELRDFLSRAGFLHLRGVFSDDEMAALGEEADRLAGEAHFDDGRSWWAKTSDGRDVCCRVVYPGERSELVRRVARDPRILRLVGLADRELRLCSDRLDGEPLLLKHPDVVEGLADLPWHRDCGLGGHPVLCPSMKLGIQIDAATPDNGQLHFLAGSARTSNHPPREEALERLPVRAVETDRGDLTVHFAHAFHAAPPPAGAHGGRRTLYVNYEQPLVWDVVGAFQGYNDSVLAKRGRVEV